MRVFLAGLVLALSLATGCDDAAPISPVDLDGPRGSVAGPGPWPVTVFAKAAGQGAEVQWQIEDGPAQILTLVPARDDLMVGLLPDVPAGQTLRYFARLADGRIEPQGEPRSVQVLPQVAVAVTPSPCQLSFRWPIDGLRLTPFADAAPQAGVQLTAILQTNQADGEAARLLVSNAAGEPVAYSGQAGAGVTAFDAVRLALGENTLRAEATAPGGVGCQAEVRVTLQRP